jgi:hypothetical protein
MAALTFIGLRRKPNAFDLLRQLQNELNLHKCALISRTSGWGIDLPLVEFSSCFCPFSVKPDCHQFHSLPTNYGSLVEDGAILSGFCLRQWTISRYEPRLP